MAPSRPLSQLIYHRIQEGTGGPPVIVMHDHHQYAKDVGEWGTAASPNGRVISLESYKGVFVGTEVVGYTWFLGPQEAPSPIFFGDSLSEIERFLWDEIDRSPSETPELPYLLGIGQGGIMAIAAALAVPELISGVIAIDAFMPNVPGWNPPLAPLKQIPVILINPRESNHPGVLAGENFANQLHNWDANISTVTQPDISPDILDISKWLLKHGVKTLAR